MSVHRRVNKRRTVWIVRYRDPVPRERTFERKADAERFERYVRHQLDTDQYLDPEAAKLTFTQWAERWWPTVETAERAPSTISGYESALRIQVLPYLGERRLRTLRRIDMEEWLGKLRMAGVCELDHPLGSHGGRHGAHLGARCSHHRRQSAHRHPDSDEFEPAS